MACYTCCYIYNTVTITMVSSCATLTPRCQTFPKATSLEDSEYGCMPSCGLQQVHVSWATTRVRARGFVHRSSAREGACAASRPLVPRASVNTPHNGNNCIFTWKVTPTWVLVEYGGSTKTPGTLLPGTLQEHSIKAFHGKGCMKTSQ